MNDILLVTPLFTQLNTPYPATAYLKGFLTSKNINSFQADLGIEVFLELFSKTGLQGLFGFVLKKDHVVSENAKRIYALREGYISTIDDVIAFLQGKNQTLARQICTESFLPRASRFEHLEDMEWAFGTMGLQDQAKHLATLYLEDLSDFMVECIDPNFGFSRYAERLGRSANSFDELYENLQNRRTYIDMLSIRILDNKITATQPKLIGISVPFPGNLYSAFRCAQWIKENYPQIKILMGGGFPNTELRSLTDPRVFEFFDYISLDDGELPLELIFENVLGKNKDEFKRTFLRKNGEVIYCDSSLRSDYKQNDIAVPDYSDLLLDKYISVIEIANPMHSLWSDGRWNKLTMAYGCYWGKCTFCDISLDYIKNYDANTAKVLVDKVEQLIAQTGETGFHFVDEAAPPALMKAFALEVIKRKLTIIWWTNIRFEKSFTQDLCTLLKASGCIAVSGGLEVASDRLLKLINKGVTVEQVAKVTRNLTDAGIMVHAYLMYGFPSQTVQETVDSLEMVRQMFELGIIQSGFWHQFALTAHSYVGLNPAEFGITPKQEEISFANNDVQFKDKTGINHDKFSFGLKKSIYNFMQGLGFEYAPHDWFDFKVPNTKIRKGFILNSLEQDEQFFIKPSAEIVWLGVEPEVSYFTKTKKGRSTQMLQMTFHDKANVFDLSVEKEKGEWLLNILKKLSVHEEKLLTFSQLKANCESQFSDFELFWYSKPVSILRDNGLLAI